MHTQTFPYTGTSQRLTEAPLAPATEQPLQVATVVNDGECMCKIISGSGVLMCTYVNNVYRLPKTCSCSTRCPWWGPHQRAAARWFCGHSRWTCEYSCCTHMSWITQQYSFTFSVLTHAEFSCFTANFFLLGSSSTCPMAFMSVPTRQTSYLRTKSQAFSSEMQPKWFGEMTWLKGV